MTGRFNYKIEDEDLSTQQIADRLSVSCKVARLRLRREQSKDGPVTWAGLAVR